MKNPNPPKITNPNLKNIPLFSRLNAIGIIIKGISGRKYLVPHALNPCQLSPLQNCKINKSIIPNNKKHSDLFFL